MPKYISGQRLPWKRFWVPWDAKIRCGHDGRSFLDDPDELWGKRSNSQVRTIEQLLQKRCVILSGQPGIGKTVEIESARDRALRQRQPPDEVFWFHCRAIASPEMLRAETVAHPRWAQARAGLCEITLIIDGLDEGLRKVPELVSALTLFLKEEPRERLRLVLVCRSAEWDVSAGENLMHLWPKDERAGISELCPLRYCDAQEAARACGVDERAFLKSVFRHQVQGLAARPMTLRMLLEQFASAGDFPDTRSELYARAALRMCREFDEDRLKALRRHYKPFPVEQLYRTVSRIAALLLLTGRNTVLKRDDERPSAVELHWREAIGGWETVDGADFEVTEELVEAGLETAHFSFRGPFRYGFDHPTFAEFLAAEYLGSLSLVQLRQLMSISCGISLACADSFRLRPPPLKKRLWRWLSPVRVLAAFVAIETSLKSTTAQTCQEIGFASSVRWASGVSSAAVTIGDLNGDGILDVVVANENFGSGYSILFGRGRAEYAPPINFPVDGVTPTMETLCDLNSDGKLDCWAWVSAVLRLRSITQALPGG